LARHARILLAALGAALAATPAAAASGKGGVTGCDAFGTALAADASELAITLNHAIVVSRAEQNANVFDIATNGDVDGTLSCVGDKLVRFEARVTEPASERAKTNFARLSVAALRAAFGYDANKAKATFKRLDGEAAEYLKASRERGDVYISGKTEEHLSGNVSLGVIETDSDRAFIIVGQGG
jgi:hypothetical protein